MVLPLLSSSAPLFSVSPLCCGGAGGVYAAFLSNNESKGTSLVGSEGVRRQRQDECFCECVCMHARSGCKGGKQQRGTSLDKYTNYSFSAEKLQSASATV